MFVCVPNEVLDLHTLKFVLAGVLKTDRLIAGQFRRKRRVLGVIPWGEDVCAVGACGAPNTDPEELDDRDFWDWANAHDLDPQTIAAIVTTNDTVPGTPEMRWSFMLDWLTRCIAYAENVKREIEGKQASYNVQHQIKPAA